MMTAEDLAGHWTKGSDKDHALPMSGADRRMGGNIVLLVQGMRRRDQVLHPTLRPRTYGGGDRGGPKPCAAAPNVFVGGQGITIRSVCTAPSGPSHVTTTIPLGVRMVAPVVVVPWTIFPSTVDIRRIRAPGCAVTVIRL